MLSARRGGARAGRERTHLPTLAAAIIMAKVIIMAEIKRKSQADLVPTGGLRGDTYWSGGRGY